MNRLSAALVGLCAASGLAGGEPASAQAVVRGDALEPTIATHTGPWYQPGAARADALWRPGDPGTPLALRGRVVDTRGLPVAGALVEFWHTDHAGNYPPLRASVLAGVDGAFTIKTVFPGHNQGYRARHIHFIVSRDGYARLITRIYFRGDRNMDEAPWPVLAITLEDSVTSIGLTKHGNVQFVMTPE